MQPTFPTNPTPPESAVPPPPYRESDRWQLVERILKSHGFAKSPRLSSFLTYICTCALEGRSGDAQEQQIGIHVFGRSPAYNPSEDSVVRSQARLIRQKLEEYFEDEGRNEPIRIVVPKGTYFPQFVPYTVSSSAESILDHAPVPEIDSKVAASGSAVRSFGIRSVALGFALLLVVGLLTADIWVRQRKSPQPPPPNPVWAALFNSRQRTIIVPSDSTLVFLEELTGASVHITEYSEHTYLNRIPPSTGLSPATLSLLGSHQYTSMADLNLAMRLSKLPESTNTRVEVRFARNLTLTDMKEANLVLIGGERANPWTELFERRTKFHVNFDLSTKSNTVVDLAPEKGSPGAYAERSAGTERIVYGVVAYLPGMCDGCDAMLVQGTSMAGTEGAADFLFDNQGFREFTHKIARPDGSVPHFELLLQTSSVGGNAPKASVLTYRLLP